MANDPAMDMRESSKVLAIGRNQLIRTLLDHGWIKRTEFGYCTCGSARKQGVVQDKSHMYYQKGQARYSNKVLLTAEGITAIRQILEEENEANHA